MRSSNSLPAFLLAIRQSIVDAGVVPDKACQITTEERFLEYPQGQYLVMVIPGPIIPEYQEGAGYAETIFSGTLRFRLVAQNVLDSAITDELALTDTNTTTGLYVLFQKLLPVVRFWDGCDGINSYLIEPVHIAESGLTQPRRDSTHEQYIYMELPAQYRICIATGGSAR